MIFEFYWTWYEDYRPYILEGPKKTQEEFEADCKKAMKECFADYISNVGDTWAGLPDWIEVAVKKMEDYGYEISTITKFGYFGLYLPKTDRYCDENNKLSRIEYEKEYPEFQEEIKRIMKHNDAIDEELYSEKDEKDAH
jgi:hypothetical protein